MRGLLRRQWYAYSGMLTAALAVLTACVCYHGVLYLFIEPFAALLIAMLPAFALNDDAVSHFDRWHVILPVKRQRYGDAYYLMTALLTLLLLTAHTVAWFRSGLDEGYVMTVGILLILCLLAPAVYLPVTFRFGIVAGRLTAITMTLPYILMVLRCIDMWGFLGDLQMKGFTAFIEAGLLPVAVPVLLFAVSRNLSARALQTKEY